MGSETSILLMLALTLCVALLGPGLISIEDTRATKRPPSRETSDIIQQD
jgi:hypothetical protein